MLQAAQVTPWAPAAVRDTIATIARQPDYQRALTDSIWSRIVRWCLERIAELFDSVGSTPGGRYIAIGLLVLAVSLIALRIAIGINADRALGRTPRTVRAGEGVSGRMADADRLAAEGNFTAAAHALFAALLAACAARGDVRLHASKTTGDYARELRRRTSPSLGPFQAFRTRYDRVIYGDLECSPEDYAVLAREAQSLIGHGRAA